MRVNTGVKEQVCGHPTSARCNAMFGQGFIEIFRTIDVTRIADIVVIFGGAGHSKSVMTSDCILHDLNKRHHLLIKIF